MKRSKAIIDGTTLCSEDKTWLCTACGKKSRTKYGFDINSINVCDRGWDSSCMLNAILIKKEKLKDIKPRIK